MSLRASGCDPKIQSTHACHGPADAAGTSSPAPPRPTATVLVPPSQAATCSQASRQIPVSVFAGMNGSPSWSRRTVASTSPTRPSPVPTIQSLSMHTRTAKLAGRPVTTPPPQLPPGRADGRGLPIALSSNASSSRTTLSPAPSAAAGASRLMSSLLSPAGRSGDKAASSTRRLYSAPPMARPSRNSCAIEDDNLATVSIASSSSAISRGPADSASEALSTYGPPCRGSPSAATRLRSVARSASVDSNTTWKSTADTPRPATLLARFADTVSSSASA